MEDLELLPTYIELPSGRVWLTLGTWNKGWQACYTDHGGQSSRLYHTYGKSPTEALRRLQEQLNFIATLNTTVITENPS